MMQKADQNTSLIRVDSTRAIGQWQTYKIEARSEKFSLAMWLCEEIVIDRALIIKMYSKMPGMSSLVNALEKSLEFKGFPVLMNLEMEVMGSKMNTQIKLLTANKRTLEESLFIVPEDYKQIESPFKVKEN